jgi:hypothetical protein
VRSLHKDQSLNDGPIDWWPFKSAQSIEIPTDTATTYQHIVAPGTNAPSMEKLVDRKDATDAFACMLVYGRIAKHMKWRRLTGEIKRYHVFEEPIVVG